MPAPEPINDPVALLERATPTSVPTTDYHQLARGGRRRRRIRRGVGIGSVVMAMAIVAIGVVASLDEPAQRVEVAAQPVEPVWERVAELPGPTADAYTAVTSDGWILVSGGSTHADDGDVVRRDDAVVDPDTGNVDVIPAPPIEPRPLPFRSLANDRLLVFGGNDDAQDGAVWNLDDETWDPIPPVPTTPHPGGTLVHYWDGQTMIVGGIQDDDTVRLWRFARAAGWHELAVPDLPRGKLASAQADGRLALVATPPDRAERTTMAILDVDSDQWTTTNDLPAVDRAAVTWSGDRVLLVPLPSFEPARSGPDDRGQPVDLPAPVAISVDGAIEALPALPDSMQRSTVEFGDSHDLRIDPEPIAVVHVGRTAAVLLPDDTWTPATTGTDIARVGTQFLAVDAPWLPGHDISIRTWMGDGWSAPSTAGEPIRGFTDIVTGRDAIYIAGGATLVEAAPTDAAEDGEPATEVELHDDVIRYTPPT